MFNININIINKKKFKIINKFWKICFDKSAEIYKNLKFLNTINTFNHFSNWTKYGYIFVNLQKNNKIYSQ